MEQYIVSKKQAKESGINLDMVDYCRQIRRIAQLDRVVLDTSVHKDNQFNTHLFPYIKYCGLEPLDFIKGYLANLQPYMLEQRKSQEKKENFTCVLDKAYRISLYIKVDKTKNNEVIVSFHENRVRGYAPENNTIRNFNLLQREIVPVIGEPTGARMEGSEKEEIKVFIQRGMLLLPIQVMARACEGNIYLVERGSLENPIVEQCNQYLRDLYTSNIELSALDNVEIFSVLQQISFTSYGNTIFSNLTLLIDNLDIQRGLASKAAADFVLATYIDHLYLTMDQAEELIDVLNEKYAFSSKQDMKTILTYISDKLLASADTTLKIIDVENEVADSLQHVIDSHNETIVPVDANGNIMNLARRKRGR